MALQVTMIGLLSGIFGTGLGGVLSVLFKKKVDKYIEFFMGLSGGIMLAIVVLDLMKEAMEMKGIFITVLTIVLGMISIDLIKDKIDIPEDEKSGIMIFISVLIHNLPEGIAIGSSFITSPNLGIALAITIAIHNVPEGLAVGIGLTGIKMKAMKTIIYTIIAGVPMGIGSFLGVYFGNKFETLIGIFLALAAGAMLYVALVEILPRTRYIFCIFGFLVGAIIVYCI